MISWNTIVSQMKLQGINFLPAVEDDVIEKIQSVYHFTFPQSMRDLLKLGLPYQEGTDLFPIWTDFSEENQLKIRQRLQAPIEWLGADVKNGYWNPSWGKRPSEEDVALVFHQMIASAPILIPIYSHRYLPVVENMENPPVISAVGSDIIYYGSDLAEYLENEFIAKKITRKVKDKGRIPFWGDLIN